MRGCWDIVGVGGAGTKSLRILGWWERQGSPVFSIQMQRESPPLRKLGLSSSSPETIMEKLVAVFETGVCVNLRGHIPTWRGGVMVLLLRYRRKVKWLQG